MLRLIIIEDEKPALKQLKYELEQSGIAHQVVKELETIEESVSWLNNDPPPFDLVFMDITLPDGLSFAICSEARIDVPVIFITAHNNFYIEAFRNNGIDYILKPINFYELKTAILKYTNMLVHFSRVDQLVRYLDLKSKKNKVIVKRGDGFGTVKITDVVYFFCDRRIVFLVDIHSQKHMTQYANLIDLEPYLSNDDFFKANRKYIVNINHLKKYKRIDKNRIQLEFPVPSSERVILSQGNTLIFKQLIKTI